MKYFEDIKVGDVDEIPGPTVTREDIFNFAKEWDPQPHHLDPAAGEASILGGLSASGWHNCAMLMRMVFTNPQSEGLAFLGSPGVEEVRWKKPVLEGDTLRATGEVTEARESRSKPFMGLVKRHFELFNQKDELLMTMDVVGMIAKRPTGTGDAGDAA